MVRLSPPNRHGSPLTARARSFPADFELLARMLRGIRGRFILSINDCPEIREMFGRAEIEEVGTRCSANARANRRVTELLVSGGG